MENVLAELLPQLTRLSNTLGRGRLYERARAGAGVTLERPAMTILMILNTAGEPLRIGEIANRMQVEGPHVTRQVQVLEKDGLVERVTDPADARARLIALTTRGQNAATQYLTVILRWFDEALADWPAADRRDLTRLLTRMVDDLSTHLA
jgi:DNA-binding MarR family transcriptional regulator